MDFIYQEQKKRDQLVASGLGRVVIISKVMKVLLSTIPIALTKDMPQIFKCVVFVLIVNTVGLHGLTDKPVKLPDDLKSIKNYQKQNTNQDTS